jgi:GAF domain-containing protein
VDEVARVLHATGVLAALAFLNARVRFRYTGIFRPEPPLLRNIRLFDRENPTLNVSGNVIALIDGYCGIACSTNAPFATGNSERDPRLRSHPARLSMRSYAGVPIRAADGSAWGTLCHFDMRPRIISATEVPLLKRVVPLFAEWVREYASSEGNGSRTTRGE